MLNLEPVEVVHVIDVLQMSGARVVGHHADEFVVATGFIGHPEHPDRAAADHAPGERRGAHQDHRVQRVTVEPQGVIDEAVVVGVLSGGEQSAVKANAPTLVVDLVLVAAAAWNFDGDVELHSSS